MNDAREKAAPMGDDLPREEPCRALQDASEEGEIRGAHAPKDGGSLSEHANNYPRRSFGN